MARTPYYDEEEKGSGGTGGTKMTKAEIRALDGVETKPTGNGETGVIYIDANGKISTWNGTKYVSASGDDSTMIPIYRTTNNTENVAPLDSELQGLTKSKDRFAVVHLRDGNKEYWKYGTSWTRVLFIPRRPRTVHNTSIVTTENILPDALSFPNPVSGDIYIKQHIDAKRLNSTFVEVFSYNGTAWSRSNVYYNNSPRIYELGNVRNFTITATNRSTHYLVDAGSLDTNIKLPPVATGRGNIITFKADGLASGKKINISPSAGATTIDNVTGAYSLTEEDEAVTLFCDGDEWHILNTKKDSATVEGGEVSIIRTDEGESNQPTTTEFGRLPRAGDRAVIKLGLSGIWEGWQYGTSWTRHQVVKDKCVVLIKDDQGDDMTINQKETSAKQDKGTNIIYTVQPPTGKRVASITGTYGKVLSKERNEVALYIPTTYSTGVIEVKLAFEDIPASSSTITSTLNHIPQFSNATGSLKDSEIEVLNNKTIVTKGLASVHGDGDFVVSLTCGANRRNQQFTGCAVIALPTARDNMFTFEIKISEYITGKSATLWVHGHQVTNTTFDTCSAHTSGELQLKKVRYAVKNNMGYIILGEDTDTHNYFQVVVAKAVSSHNGHNQMFRDMAVTFESDTSTWTDKQIVEFDKSKPKVTLSSIITFQNSWSGVSGEWNPEIRKDKDGTVFIEGLIIGGNKNTIVGTLPVGWRPERTVLYHAPAQSETETRIDISTNGEILVRDGSRTDGWWVAIRVSYKAS